MIKSPLMMIFNIGSSSIKIDIFNITSGEKILKINKPTQNLEHDLNECILNLQYTPDQFAIIGHRVVHGGKRLPATVEINDKIINEIKQLEVLAPIHNPINLIGINIALKYFKKSIHYASFDNGYFKDLPNYTKTIAIPKNLRENYDIQKYGFHGLNHQFIAESNLDSKRIISVHLGSGCSITLSENQKPIDTSMSFSPVSGVIMSTRSGDIDPEIIFVLEKYKVKDIEEILNFKSGLKALSEKTGSLKEIYENKDSISEYKLAYDCFIYSIVKNISSFLAQSPTIDKIIFSGGISENNEEIVKEIISNLNNKCYNSYEIQEANESKQIYNNIIKLNAS